MPKTLSAEDIEGFRERLCDVAERLFAQHGPEAVTVRQLAGELGVSPMTPYRYFKDKDAMLAAVRARAFDRFAQAMEAAQAPGAPPQIDGSPYVDWALANPEAYKLIFDVNQATYTAYPDLMAAMQRARATMSMGMGGGAKTTVRDQQRQARGAGRAAARGARDARRNGDPLDDGDDIDDMAMIAHVIWATMHGPIMLQLAGLLRPPLDAQAIVKEAMATLIGAYRTRRS